MRMHASKIVAAVLLLWATGAAAQFKQSSHPAISLSCLDEIADRDYESATLTFNPTSQELNMALDIKDVLARNFTDATTGDAAPETVPMQLNVKMSIPDLDFKSAANNGETYTFDTRITCNGVVNTMQVQYVFLFAPKVSETINGAPLCAFRIDFVLHLRAEDFGFSTALPDECKEIIINMHDGILNKVNY